MQRTMEHQNRAGAARANPRERNRLRIVDALRSHGSASRSEAGPLDRAFLARRPWPAWSPICRRAGSSPTGRRPRARREPRADEAARRRCCGYIRPRARRSVCASASAHARRGRRRPLLGDPGRAAHRAGAGDRTSRPRRRRRPAPSARALRQAGVDRSKIDKARAWPCPRRSAAAPARRPRRQAGRARTPEPCWPGGSGFPSGGGGGQPPGGARRSSPSAPLAGSPTSST